MTPWFITFHFYRCLWQFFKQKRQLYNLTSPNVRRDVPEIFYSRLKIYLSPVHKLWRTINSRDILPWLFLAVLRYVDQPGDKKIWIMGLREHFFSLILANTFWNFFRQYLTFPHCAWSNVSSKLTFLCATWTLFCGGQFSGIPSKSILHVVSGPAGWNQY